MHRRSYSPIYFDILGILDEMIFLLLLCWSSRVVYLSVLMTSFWYHHLIFYKKIKVKNLPLMSHMKKILLLSTSEFLDRGALFGRRWCSRQKNVWHKKCVALKFVSGIRMIMRHWKEPSSCKSRKESLWKKILKLLFFSLMLLLQASSDGPTLFLSFVK